MIRHDLMFKGQMLDVEQMPRAVHCKLCLPDSRERCSVAMRTSSPLTLAILNIEEPRDRLFEESILIL
jgi:hypothetical protein